MTEQSEIVAAERALALALTEVDENGIRYPVEPPCSADPDAWFPAKGADMSMQKRACLDVCPGAMECRALAVIRGETVGIWGGWSASSLKKARKRL